MPLSNPELNSTLTRLMMMEWVLLVAYSNYCRVAYLIIYEERKKYRVSVAISVLQGYTYQWTLTDTTGILTTITSLLFATMIWFVYTILNSSLFALSSISVLLLLDKICQWYTVLFFLLLYHIFFSCCVGYSGFWWCSCIVKASLLAVFRRK